MAEIIVTLGDNVVNKYVFEKDVISIGRSRDNDVCVENLAVSRNHARIRRQNDSFILSDLNSANGTFVNGVRVQKTELFNDDVITIGKHKLIFKNVALSDEALISDAFGAERTMIMDQAPVAYLVVTRGKQKELEFRIDKTETTIGRSGDCDVALHDWFVSKQHAVIHRQGNAFLLRDAGSWRGTKVNDDQVTETVLKDGDEIQLGGTRMLFRLVSEETVRPPEGRVPLELETNLRPVEQMPAPEPGTEEVAEPTPPDEEPIRAGGEEDFIEPSAPEAPEMVGEQETFESEPLFGDMEEELRESAEMIREAVGEGGEVVDVASETPEAPETEAPTEVEERAESPIEPEPLAADDTQPQIGAPAETAEPVGVAEEETIPPPALEPEVADEEKEEEPAEAPTTEPTASPGEVSDEEIRMWEEALKNRSAVIRKQAAKMLKKLTGRDYDY